MTLTGPKALIGAVVVLNAAAVALPIQADGGVKGIVCWTDEHGARACGDHVPPQFAKKQREVYDARGVLVQTYDAELTPEQRADAERKAQADQVAAQQQQNDAFLLQTYRNAGDLEAVRDSRLQSLDTHIGLAEKAVHDGEAAIKDLQDRVDAERLAGHDPNPDLQTQIGSFENAQAQNIRVEAQARQERELTAAEFDREIRRYRALTAPAVAPAAPAAPSVPAPKAP
jgi:hypothetical protein